jgi:uncharacterized protein with beta-barrel porin domain
MGPLPWRLGSEVQQFDMVTLSEPNRPSPPATRSVVRAFCFAGAGAILLAASPAWSACVPNGPAIPSGSTVICTGADTTGVGNLTQNNVIVTVQPGASITLGDNVSDIRLNDNNVVTNNGTITAGDNHAFGIRVHDNNVVTNTGAIVLGIFGIGIQTNAASTTVNTGTISVGNFGIGIGSDGSGSSIINSGSVTLTAGGTGLGSFGSNSSPIFNSGAITLLNGSGIGIYSQGSNSVVSNSAAITISNGGGQGIITQGLNGGIVNSGDINIKFGGFGLQTYGASSAITNSGAIVFGGAGSIGIQTNAADSGVTNSGAISVVGGPGIITNSSNSGITNSGMVTVSGDGGIGLQTSGTGSAVSNSGTITLAGLNGIGIQTNAADSGVVNSGAINVADGSGIVTHDSHGSITNSGIITVGGNFGVGVSTLSGDVVNSGTIQTTGGRGTAISGRGNISNSGIVVGGKTGFGIQSTGLGVSILNSGTVSGGFSLQSGGGNATISNTGVLDGGLSIINTGNTFTNSGLVTITASPFSLYYHFVIGAFTQTAAGTLALRVANDGAHDIMQVSGTASLGGTLGAVVQPGLYANATTYLGAFIANNPFSAANPFTGSFAQTAAFATGTTTPLAFFTVTPTYNANSVDITLNRTPFGAVPGETQNQRNVGNALEQAYATTLTGAPASFFSTLLQSTSSDVLKQAAGETATGSQQTTFQAMTQFMGVLLDPFIGNRGDTQGSPTSATSFTEESAYAAAGRKHTSAERDAYAMFTKAPLAKSYEPRWSVWAAGFGGSQSTDGNAALGSNDTTSRVFGVAAGADYLLSPRTIAGFALAGGGTNFSVANNTGTGHSDLFQAGAFVRHTVGPLYISAALAYGWQDVTTDRTVTIAGVDQLRAHFNANAFSGRVEGGYRFVTPWIGGIGITPYAAGQFTTFDLPAYAESVLSGANMFALSYASKSVTASRSELGLRTDKSYALESTILTLRSRLAWAHDFSTDRSVAATFQTLPGASFVVNGAVQAHDSALTTASAEMKWLNGVSLAATFEGEFSDVTKSYAGKGVARYQW